MEDIQEFKKYAIEEVQLDTYTFEPILWYDNLLESDIPHKQKVVMLAVAGLADNEGYFEMELKEFYRIAGIAKESFRSVYNTALAQLQREGLLTYNLVGDYLQINFIN